MNDQSPGRTNKFKANRARKKAMGLKQVRLWVPDVNAPGFQEKLDAEIAAINAAEDSKTVLRSADESAAELWNRAD